MTAAPQTHRVSGARNTAVDGLRTVAILWVAWFHFAHFWSSEGKGTALLPYDAVLAEWPLARIGVLGVNLFFVVSGFVIATSLERSRNGWHFAGKRLRRLWPTLILCASLTFCVTTLLGPEALRRSWAEFLLSLTLVPPAHIGALFGANGLQWLDGAYWSLWTEIRFYLIAACLYFMGPATFLRNWAIFALFGASVHLCAQMGVPGAGGAGRLLFSQYQAFFTLGIALAALRCKGPGALAIALVAGAMAQMVWGLWQAHGALRVGETAGIAAIVGLSLWAMLARGPLPVLSWRWVVVLGQASYAYYLLHQNLGLALLNAVATGTALVDIGAMLVIQAGLLGLSVWLTRAVDRLMTGPWRARTGHVPAE